MITTSPIEPTVGRVVLFHSSDGNLMGTGGSPIVPALITHVHSPNCVNVMVMRDGHAATPVGVSSVTYSEPEEGDELPGHGWWWMPYQKAVAAERDPATGVAAGA